MHLSQPDRYSTALETYDPLRGTWMLGAIDPWPRKREYAAPYWLRIVCFLVIIFLPMPISCFYGSPTFGGKFFGKGSFTADIGVFSIFLFLIIATTLLPIGRRLIGTLINELVCNGTVDGEIKQFDPLTMEKGPLLWFFEWASRVEGFRGILWFSLMLIDQVVVYWSVVLKDGTGIWNRSDAIPGTVMHFLSVGGSQPNIAGLWMFMVFGPTILYLMIVIARLIVVYACLCKNISDSKTLRIIPSHPDGTGGLSPIGKTSLFLSIFTFALGVNLAGITLNELVIIKVFRSSGDIVSSTPIMLIALWIMYFIIGTALFMLPLFPLRSRMSEAKQLYLAEVISLYDKAELNHRIDLKEGIFRPDALQGLGTLDSLYRSAEKMAVWPFDSTTILRYGGMLISPVLPIIADQIPVIVFWIKKYLGLAL